MPESAFIPGEPGRKLAMTKCTLAICLVLALSAPVAWAGGNEIDKQAKKLDQELKKISLAAADLDGRRVVNRVMAGQLGVSRVQLVRQRRQTGFLYGQLFGAHEVARQSGVTFAQVAQRMNQGHSLLEISQQHSLALKSMVADARKLNKKIDSELDKVAGGEEDEQAQDNSDGYDPSGDSLEADTSSFTPAELAQAKQQAHQRGYAFGRMGMGEGRGMGASRGASAGMKPGLGRRH